MVAGKIYAIPSHSRRVLMVDPEGDEARLIGPDLGPGKFKWLRAVATEDLVVGIPCWSDKVLIINCTTQEVDTFPAPPDDGGNWRWHGGQVGPDGIVRAVPTNAGGVLAVDPIARTAEIVGPEFEGRTKYYGGILGNEGDSMYCVPYKANRVLKIPMNGCDEPVLIGPELPEDAYNFHGGIYSPIDESIYSFPAHGAGVLRIHAPTDKVEIVGNLPDTRYKWLGGAASPCGKYIYGMPSDTDTILKIVPDPVSPSVHTIPSEHLDLSKNKYQGGVPSPSSPAVYAIPSNADRILKVDTRSDFVEALPKLPNPSIKDKFQGGFSFDRFLYLIPECYPNVLKVDTATDEITHIPIVVDA